VASDCCDAWGRGGVLGCYSLSSAVVSSLLSEVSPFGGGPLVERRACQDGRGPQSAGHSGTCVAGCKVDLQVGTSISHLTLPEYSGVGSHVS
jgi:hypothetical protein